MNFHPAQSLIAKDNHRFRVVCCGRRFGKTILAVWEMTAKAMGKGGRNIAYIAPTYQQARDIAWQELKKVTKSISKNVNESRLEITVKSINEGESRIVLRGWESVETLRGQKFDFIVIDEVAMMRNFNTSWQEVVRPTLTDTAGHVLFLSTPKGFNHFYDLFNEEANDKDFKSFHFSSYDNPFLPIEELDKAKSELPPDRFAQEYEAKFSKIHGLVYKEFDRKRHLFTDEGDDKATLPAFAETMLGVDFGFTAPAAILYVKRDTDNNYWIFDEWYKTQQENDQIKEKALSFSPNVVYPDPEAPEKILVLQRGGLNCREVKKGKDSVTAGIDKVRSLFLANRIHIHKKNCPNLIFELESYAYDPDLVGKAGELPIKENDHACDALRYIIMTNNPRIYKPKIKTQKSFNPITGY